MKYRRLRKILALTVFAGVVLWAAYPTVLYRLGIFLVVDEDVETVDAVVTSRITSKVVACYKSGGCKKVFIKFEKTGRETWMAFKQGGREERVRKRAAEMGIDDKDLFFLQVHHKDNLQHARFFKNFFARHKIRSALFLLPDHKTRRYRFYFDRYFQNAGIAAYVQPDSVNYEPKFERWWEQTTLANFFLDEYLRIAWYLFNKLLWSSAV